MHEQRLQIVHALGSPSAAPSPPPVLPAAIPVPARGGERSPGPRAASTFIRLPPACSGHASFPSGAPGKRVGAVARGGEAAEGGRSTAKVPEVGPLGPSASPGLGGRPARAGCRPRGRGGRSLTTCSRRWLCGRGAASPCSASGRRGSPGTARGRRKYLAPGRGPGLPLLRRRGAREVFVHQEFSPPALGKLKNI